MLVFLRGMEAMGFLIAGLLFVRYWRKTNDLLFVAFAGAFCLFALGQFLLALPLQGGEESGLVFLPRLFGFALLILAILAKNL